MKRQYFGHYLSFVFLPVLLFLVIGCATTPKNRERKEKTPPPLAELEKSKIQKLIDSNEPFKALQLLSAYENYGVGAKEARKFIEQSRRRGVELLIAGFKKSLEDKNYLEAITYFKSIVNIGAYEDLADNIKRKWNLKRLYYELGRKYREENNNYVALYYYFKSLTLGNRDRKNLESILELAYKLKNKVIYDKVIAIYRKENLVLPEKYRDRKLAVSDLSRMVRGTVTVWVDRGIKIKEGVGYPDRVIGSGFFIDDRGYLITNYHVIKSEVDPEYEGYSRLYVKLSENSEEKIPAKVVGYDRIFDIALLKVEVTPGYVFYPAENVMVKTGDKIFAIGSPGGLENTVTSGIVSAVDRKFLQLGTAIQVDAPLNPGNSGGPLLNANAELIGVVFAGIEQFEGVNFAIPWSWVRGIIPYLYNSGEHREAWLGVSLYEGEKGLEVIYTVPDEPADIIGLKSGDIIESVNGKKIRTREELDRILLNNTPKTLMRIVWKRGNHRYRGIVSLDVRPYIPIEMALERDDRDRVIYPLFGMKLEKTGSFLWKTNYMVEKVLTGSIADETGISRGDPLNIQGWRVDKKKKFAILQIYIKKRKAGFLESVVQLISYLETDNFY